MRLKTMDHNRYSKHSKDKLRQSISTRKDFQSTQFFMGYLKGTEI